MNTTDNNSDKTRMIELTDSTVLNDNAYLNKDNDNTVMQQETGTQPEAPARKAKAAKKSSINSTHFAAAGIGAVAGAAATAAATASADTHAASLDLDNATSATGHDDIGSDARNAGFGNWLDKDITDTDSAVEVTIDPETGAQSTTVHPDSINININVNNPAATTGTQSPLEVSGPNPAEAVHQAGIDLHNSAAAYEPEPVIAEPAEQPGAGTQASAMPHDLSVSSAGNVNDSMSFSQAFAAARAEVGPGGSFTWHGQVYGTYYQNEWDAMTPQQQQEFQMAAIDNHSAANNTVEDPLYASKPTEAVEYDQPQYVDNYDDEVHVINMGEIEGDNDTSYQIAQFEVNGNTALVIDTDQDMIYDVMHIDLNQDGEVTPDELYDITDQQLSTNDVAQQLMIQESQEQAFDINGSTYSDFDNNVDVSGFDA